MGEPKITTLPYKSPRCIECGRDLPRGRRQRCYACRPFKSNKAPPPVEDPDSDRAYTLADRAAQADAYGISYGRLMAIVENNWPLPPLIHRIRWPEDNVHAGE